MAGSSSRVVAALFFGAIAPLAALGQGPPPAVAGTDSVHPSWRAFHPEFREAPCDFAAERLKDRIVCGYVLVPENRSTPDTRLLRLSVLRVTGENPDPDRTVVHLAGGPGGSAIQFLYQTDGARDDLTRLVAQGDLVLVDPRGAGYSEPWICRGIVGRGLSDEEEARYRQAMRQCLGDARERGIWLEGLSTWHQAHDVRDVRRALGLERWNLWSLSYGTRLAEAVMQVDPEGTRAVILDSTSPPVFPTSVAYGMRSSLEEIGRWCEQHADCARDVGDLPGRFIDALARYDEEPLNLEGLDERAVPDGRLTIDGGLAATFLFGLLYSSANYDDLPAILRLMEDHDVDAMRSIAQRLSGSGPSRGAAMGLVTTCRWDPPSPDSLAAWRRAEPVLDRWPLEADFGRNSRERCEELFRIDPDPSVRTLESDIPTLLLSGLADPITPPSYAAAVAGGLTHVTLIEVPHTGHNVIGHLNRYQPGCGTALMHAFFADPDGAVAVGCEAAIRPPDFVTDLRATPRLSRFLFGVVGGGRRPVLPAVALLALLWAVVGYPLAFLGRRIDGVREPGLSRTRTLSWAGAVLCLGGALVAVAVFFRMARLHQTAIVVGWLPAIAWAGWLSLAGTVVALSAVGLYMGARRTREGRVWTAVGVTVSALAAAAVFGFLLTVGAGPI